MMTNTLVIKRGALYRFGYVLALNWLLVVGFLVLCVPSAWRMATTVWRGTEQGHGPIVLAIVVWLFWGVRHRLGDLPLQSSVWGWISFSIAVLCYILGRSNQIYLFEIGAFIPLLAGIILLNWGMAGLRVAWFPLLFLVFLIPLPAFVVDTLTGTLKQHVSEIAEFTLFKLGFPIARSGVLLQIGPYELMVADACSGMNSMFSLYAVGALYLYLQQHASRLRNVLLLLAVAPIAFIANVFRVMVLVLVTYRWGDEVGQGFIHEFSGLILFAVALIALFFVDVLLSLIWRREAQS